MQCFQWVTLAVAAQPDCRLVSTSGREGFCQLLWEPHIIADCGDTVPAQVVDAKASGGPKLLGTAPIADNPARTSYAPVRTYSGAPQAVPSSPLCVHDVSRLRLPVLLLLWCTAPITGAPHEVCGCLCPFDTACSTACGQLQKTRGRNFASAPSFASAARSQCPTHYFQTLHS